MQNRIPFIFNPSSGSGFQESVLQYADDLIILGSKSKEDSLQIVDCFIQQGVSKVILSGGDGTLNSAINQLVGTETALGICPTGTMNVFARELGIPTTDLNQAFEIIREGHTVEVDVFRLNGAPFIQMAGIGYDAHLIEETSSQSKGYQAVLDLTLKLIADESKVTSQLSDKITYVQSSSLTITSDTELPYELDGEYIGRAKQFTIEKDPKKLKVLAPQAKLENEWAERMSALWSLSPLR